MNTITACLSMLHEPADLHSGTRLFRARPVLDWTLSRLARSETIDAFAILCWEDQLEQIKSIADRHNTHILAKGPRECLPQVESISAARRWADGWRGGLLGTCDFDLGFYAPWIKEIIERLASDAVVLVDPSAGLVDSSLLDDLVEHAEAHPSVDFCFSPAAPGLSGVLLRGELVNRLASGKVHPGSLLQYRPDQPVRDPISTESCAPVPTAVARTTHRFKLDSDRQIARMDRATYSFNGTLIITQAEEIAVRMNNHALLDPMPREVVLELTSKRLTKPIFSPLVSQQIDRPEMSAAMVGSIVNELASVDDMRLTLAGVGDPLLHPEFLTIVGAAREAGIHAIHVETDLLELTGTSIEALANAGIDVISIHLPAGNRRTYQAVMHYDGMAQAMDNVRRLNAEIVRIGKGLPLLVPVFMKCRQNLGEMEACYDHWLRTLGHCVIAGPTDFGGLIENVAVADMAPPKRIGCRRLNSRMTILSDGTVASCEQDVLGRQKLGQIGQETIKEIWQKKFSSLREAHACGKWSELSVCRGCCEWHRP